MKDVIGWTDSWHCEDCGFADRSVGVPEKCPNCGSENTTPNPPPSKKED